MQANWEPAWTSQQDANRAIDLLKLRNANDLKTAIGASTNPITELKPVRNFVAHRGHISASKLELLAKSLGKTWNQPGDLFLDDGFGTFRFGEWSSRFLAVANAAII
jgi:hypothetical protein